MSVDFDGGSDRNLYTATTLNGGNAVFDGGGSMCVWFSLDGWGEANVGRLIDINTGGVMNADDVQIYVSSSGNVFWRWDAGGSETRGSWNTPNSSVATDGTWYCLVVTHDVTTAWTTEDPVMYLDGVSQSLTVANPTGARSGIAFADITIGAGVGLAREWDGRIAHLSFWDTELTLAQAQALAAGASPLSVQPSNLVNYWPLIRDYQDVVAGNTLTNNNSVGVSADNPGIILPAPFAPTPSPAKGKVWVNDAASWDSGAVQQTHPGTGWTDTSIAVGQVIDTTGLTGQLYLGIERVDGKFDWHPISVTAATDALLADDIESTSELTVPVLAQVHALLANSIESVTNLSGPTLDRVASACTRSLIRGLTRCGILRDKTRALGG
jgi:hypothetical protein